MQKLLSMLVVGGLVVGGLVGASALPAFACGGGGGGCSMSGGGYGDRAVSYGKVSGPAPMLAQTAPQVAPQQTKPTTALVDVNKRVPLAAVRTVAAKVKAADKAAAKSPIYTCPMHPQVQWTKPTDCPICGMKLKLKQTKADLTKRAPAAADEHAGMDTDDMSDMQGMNHDEMGGKQAPAAAQKASGGKMRMAGMGCGC